VPLKGVIDLEAERARLGKRQAELEKGLAALRKKLSSENFISRAPAEIVGSERNRQKALADELATIHTSLSELTRWQD